MVLIGSGIFAYEQEKYVLSSPKSQVFELPGVVYLAVTGYYGYPSAEYLHMLVHFCKKKLVSLATNIAMKLVIPLYIESVKLQQFRSVHLSNVLKWKRKVEQFTLPSSKPSLSHPYSLKRHERHCFRTMYLTSFKIQCCFKYVSLN